MKKKALVVALTGVFVGVQWLPMPAFAQQVQTEQQQSQEAVEVITVVAHRQPRQLSEVAGTVTVISDEQMQRNMVFNASDLVRYQAGVEIDDSSSRFGDSGFRIRGIGGNRTTVVIDQVPVADRFAVGAFADTGRGLLELGLAGRVEILRGPASTLYGSKALGGVVAVQLLTADDVLYDNDSGSRIQLGYNSDRNRVKGLVAQAYRDGDTSLLIAGAAQYGQQLNVADREGVADDPQHLRQQAMLLRAGLDTQGGRWQFTLDAMNESRDTDIRSSIGSGRQASTTELLADDARQQWRLLIDQQLYATDYFDRAVWRLFHQRSQVQQNTDETRGILPQPLFIERDFEFTQIDTGIGFDLELGTELADMRHRFGYGLELISSAMTDMRDAQQLNLTTGVLTKVLLGEQFPLRDFPRSRVTELGVYVHDEITLWRDGPVLSPGLRYENYRLRARVDSLFTERYPNTEVTDLSHDAWLPKLGLLWPVTDDLEWFAQYARGYRAPPFADVNVGLYYPQFGVLAIPNPDLKAERGYTFETGIRWRSGDSAVSVTAYHNKYRDFIQSRAPLGFDPDRQANIFQSINRDRVTIEGIEAQWQQQWTRQWATDVSVEYARGTDNSTGLALAEVAPPRLVSELRYEAANGDWESRLLVTAARGQRNLQSSRGVALFSAPGYLTVDWLNRWFINADMTLSAGIFNLTDRQYWRNSRVSGYNATEVTIPILAESGRSVGLAFNQRF
ncbi:TonB-dependent receptor domain-containing protein [Pseudidiomarina mangrovi]|uniref:TonB-dependent receptor domain-containing protein n=1 Tax=Pseudidiomarina mangrovi TaxID=2487133 RepID=UPI000FCA53CA|nr:TonB-dependent receptor [Pseudidiomarina mangrovi]